MVRCLSGVRERERERERGRGREKERERKPIYFGKLIILQKIFG